MRHVIQKVTVISALCCAMAYAPVTFAQENVDTALIPSSLEEIVSFNDGVSHNKESLEEIIQYIDVKSTLIDKLEGHENLTEEILSSNFEDLNETIANNFIEKVEVKEPAKVNRPRNRSFAWWNCTYYVANKKYVTWSGNAREWLRNAKAQWVPTGNTPEEWAIIVFIWGGYSHYWHVGIVERVNSDGTLYVSDMNYSGLNKVTHRTVKPNKAIAGYIYVD